MNRWWSWSVVAAAGGLLSAGPEFFDTVRPLLPLTPALDAIKAVAGDGSDVGQNVTALVAWLVVSVVVSVLAVVPKRQS